MKFLSSILLTLTLALSCAAQVTITPTTTLTAETSNNTSASSSFKGTTNGNIGATNISKEDTKKLLYGNATTNIFAHYMPWWGTSYHLNIGLNENDPAVVSRQVKDAMSRGIDGFIVDWYGKPTTSGSSATFNNTSTMNVKKAAEDSGSFVFALNYDSGAFKGLTTAAQMQNKVVADFDYANTNYFPSPRYQRSNGRPVVYFFINDSTALDWNWIKSHVAGNPLFIFRNSSGFAHAASDGAFGWVGISADTEGLGYLSNFYSTAAKYPTKLSVGSTYKGFDDSIASWGKNRLTRQYCGKTWLDTFTIPSKFYSQTDQLGNLQIATWNDYEEGTEIETGVDNCFSISADYDPATHSMPFSTNGDRLTIDHFTVFVSADGENLMKLADLDKQALAFNVGSYNFAPGTYYFYVKAVGMPGMTNKISGKVTYTVAPATTRSVSLTSPTDGSTVTSPVRVIAFANDSAATVSAMAAYVDGTLAFHLSAASIDTTLSMTKGAHRLTVQFWDTAGVVTKKSVSISVN